MASVIKDLDQMPKSTLQGQEEIIILSNLIDLSISLSVIKDTWNE